jgi:hypothetical protein
MVKHAKLCWCEEAWSMANDYHNVAEARSNVTEPIAATGSITASFE